MPQWIGIFEVWILERVNRCSVNRWTKRTKEDFLSFDSDVRARIEGKEEINQFAKFFKKVLLLIYYKMSLLKLHCQIFVLSLKSY